VLKSNGLHRPENLPVKFGFSPKSTSTNIAKKLPLQRCFKPLLIALFNFSHKRQSKVHLGGRFRGLGWTSGTENARNSGLFKVDVPQAFEEIAVFNNSKKVLFEQRRFSEENVYILRRCSQ